MYYPPEQINKAFEDLSKEKSEAIFVVNIDSKIENISKKYNIGEENSKILNLYTTFIVLGLMDEKELNKIIINDLKISSEISQKLITDLDNLIIKEVEKQTRKIGEKNKLSNQDKSLIFDPRFSNMPKNIQEAIALSNWRENLYKIAQKYKLSITQMGDLEEITVKVITNEISSDKYENELSFKIIISKHEISDLVNDVNSTILVEIRNLLKADTIKKEGLISNKEDDNIPLPPYAKSIENNIPEINRVKDISLKNESTNTINDIEKEEIERPEPIKTFTKNENSTQKELENIIKSIPFPTKKNVDVKVEEKETEKELLEQEDDSLSTNIIHEKLKGSTINNQTVSDYSIPKINTSSSHKNDPYREAI